MVFLNLPEKVAIAVNNAYSALSTFILQRLRQKRNRVPADSPKPASSYECCVYGKLFPNTIESVLESYRRAARSIITSDEQACGE